MNFLHSNSKVVYIATIANRSTVKLLLVRCYRNKVIGSRTLCALLVYSLVTTMQILPTRTCVFNVTSLLGPNDQPSRQNAESFTVSIITVNIRYQLLFIPSSHFALIQPGVT